ncbi:type IV pilin protein [uncultured Oxalicibacterium sp.]|uniref:type IV pilin protein n=1 Tax=uncultured Oxalicibacterium sp. TaxID=1168540 RepID=UPI0025D33446|nr:type IV pilin protein [uncultured Oxalicibacterium sp.]
MSFSFSYKRRTDLGFTLVEVMIVVAIVGILAAVVIPSYSDYVRRSALNEGFSALSQARVALEQFYQSNRSYGTAGQASPCGHDGTANRIVFGTESPHFTVTCALAGGGNQAYLLTATGSSGNATGHTYTLNNNNVKGTTLFKGTTAAKSCWLIKGGEC